ncbi:unnamed protein product [Knipowitschia caucasica]|uniref:Uncharacterized protein n=1 Tax=Knipowitschia caucasica TaxID=637954 RepID=A0AAV2JTQ4_KNICA
MGEQNGKDFTHKTNGLKGKPPYCVETPYGFQLDLDFLKYVDDIEKGNTIKRVPMQRRSKVPRASTLPRHLHLSSSGSRPSPWGSTGALGPRSRLLGAHHGFSWSHETSAPLSLAGFKSQAEMEARIKEFDEQPLGERIKPHLLRASSLPLTVLLRQSSESADDASSLRSSRDCLLGKNTSLEDLVDSHSNSGLVKRLSEALERVAELEMEVRVIPELRAQLGKVQEERERLRLALRSNLQPPSVNVNGCYTSCHYNSIDVKRPRHDSHNHLDSNASHEWRSSTDLDELLTVTSLQAKIAALEQKLHESELELKWVTGMLRERQRESGKNDDDKMDELRRNPGVWVKAERVVVQQDGEETVVKSEDTGFGSDNGVREKAAEDERNAEKVVCHIQKIRRLLDQQWDCLCSEQRAQHIDPKVKLLQQEMVGLVDLLSSHYNQPIQRQEEQLSDNSKCDTKKKQCRLLKDPDERDHSTTSTNQNNMEQSECPGEKMADAQVHDGPAERGTSPSRHMRSAGTDGNTVSAAAPEKTVRMRTAPGEQMEPGPDTAAGSEVKAAFVAACLFLKDHMNNMDNPNDDMKKALVVLFQSWFGAAAEESSKVSSVVAHVKEVKRNAPSLMAFLINMADDNANTVLHYSVSHCNYSIVSVLLDTGVADVNLQNNAGYTAMMLASLTAPDSPCGMEVVRKLMEMGSTNIKSSQTGLTALHLAVRHGRVVMVRLLLSCGADANIQDKEGTTALMFAAERGHTHIARLLLERSQCDLSLADKHGRTALSIATQGSHSDTAALLKAHAKARAL